MFDLHSSGRSKWLGLLMLQVSPVDYFLSAMFQMNKPVNKQDEPWMKPFINQFNNMNFSVSTISYCFAVAVFHFKSQYLYMVV